MQSSNTKKVKMAIPLTAFVYCHMSMVFHFCDDDTNTVLFTIYIDMFTHTMAYILKYYTYNTYIKLLLPTDGQDYYIAHFAISQVTFSRASTKNHRWSKSWIVSELNLAECPTRSRSVTRSGFMIRTWDSKMSMQIRKLWNVLWRYK